MMAAGAFLHLPDETLADLGISTADIVDGIENAVRDEARGALWTSPKSVLLPGDGRYMMTTLSAADEPQVTVVKSVMVSPRNPDRGLNGIEGAIVLFDSETGVLRAVMGASWVTAVRTAGLSAVVAKRMADPRSSKIAFIGCGVQARSHLDALCDLFPLTEIRAFGRGRANLDRLCAAARDRGLTACACGSPREAVEGADLVVSSVTLSFDLEPFVDARWLKPGAFAAITDLALPWIPESMTAFGAVIIDDHEQERASPKKMVSPDLVRADLKGLVTGEASVSFDAGKCSAFVFRGLAVGDFAVASLAWSRALAAGRGTTVRA
jgi:ornithine cyclodeaminase/alanine dehydrogenase-like protein (mu-crystallin family)